MAFFDQCNDNKPQSLRVAVASTLGLRCAPCPSRCRRHLDGHPPSIVDQWWPWVLFAEGDAGWMDRWIKGKPPQRSDPNLGVYGPGRRQSGQIEHFWAKIWDPGCRQDKKKTLVGQSLWETTIISGCKVTVKGTFEHRDQFGNTFSLFMRNECHLSANVAQ